MPLAIAVGRPPDIPRLGRQVAQVISLNPKSGIGKSIFTQLHRAGVPLLFAGGRHNLFRQVEWTSGRLFAWRVRLTLHTQVKDEVRQKTLETDHEVTKRLAIITFSPVARLTLTVQPDRAYYAVQTSAATLIRLTVLATHSVCCLLPRLVHRG